MDIFFGKIFPGAPFQHFSTPHIIVLLLFLFINLSFLYLRSSTDDRLKTIIRYGMAAVLIINEMMWHIWNLVNHQWSLQTMLPLHLCSVFVILNSIMLITKNYTIFEITYFLGIGGALQPMITPDLGAFNFPHFRFFQVFLSHGFIVTSAFYMAVVERYRPYPKSILRTLGIGNIYILFVGIVNTILGSNYLFICRPPDTPSLIDLLGPWPQYLIALELIAVMMCIILYIPYFIHDHFWIKYKLRVSD